MSLAEAIYYNAGRGPADGNNYWRRRSAGHWTWMFLTLLLWGAAFGAAASAAASASPLRAAGEIFVSPAAAALNLAPPALLTLVFFFALGRAWPALAASGVVTTGAALLDRCAVSETGVHIYAGAPAPLSGLSAAAPQALISAGTTAAAVLFAVFLMRGALRPWKARVFGAIGSAAALAALWYFAYSGEQPGFVFALMRSLRLAAGAAA